MAAHRSTLAPSRRARPHFLGGTIALTLACTAALTGCSDDAEPGVVGQGDAYTAIVMWQAAEQEPVIGADGEAQLPVIYVVSADGNTIDVGVQAAVTEATSSDAVVRFADDADDTFDSNAEGSPVHDDGVMLAVGAVPEPAHEIEVEVDRYVAPDDYEVIGMHITATETSSGRTASEETPRAQVTQATPR